jgi:WD40 repeat protein
LLTVNLANSLVAVGDEEGRVRLLESAKDGRKEFQDVYLGFRVHTNAIIDMAFSDDDSRLATASGDQTARVVDMTTQSTITILGNHSASLKQVRFQPGENNNNIVTTTSRDGCVQIWDLRCKGEQGPTARLRGINRGPEDVEPPWSRPINSIYGAHQPSYRTRSALALAGTDTPVRGEIPGRMGQVSVTCMAFLAQQHLLVTGSESDASINLWDLRSLHNRSNSPIPVSKTTHPTTHSQWRHFGTTSITLSGDGSRLYSLCKDNTVYAYSTAHLILGHAPELSQADGARRLPPKETKEGMGPIYGYRHPQLFATSFYVKTAIRKAKDGKSEMLAAGSADGCVVLFPTDDVYFPRQQESSEEETPGDRKPKSGRRPTDTIPISTNGTPLIRGHDKEAGSLSFTSEGNLISIADDFLIRVWRDGGDNDDARDLRMGGESEGRRWGCGWADIGADFDEDR